MKKETTTSSSKPGSQTISKPLILVFGTSADPFHNGHKMLLHQAVNALELQGIDIHEVIIMPVYRHNNLGTDTKQALPLTYEDRFAICELAAKELNQEFEPGIVHFSVSRLEQELSLKNNHPNFTAETMAVLRERTDPSYELGFLAGIDPFTGERPSFDKWYRLEDLLASTVLVISPRKGFTANEAYIEKLKSHGARFIFLRQLNVPEVSSTAIRQILERGADPLSLVQDHLISEATAHYIIEHKLAEVWRTLDSNDSDEPVSTIINETQSIEAKIGALLFKRKLSLSTAESCTGGLIGHRLTNIPGSSEYYMGGIISYSYEAKVHLLGVKWETIKAFGAVSSEVVLEMAAGARKQFNTDLGVSVSCIAGPGGATPNKPVGSSWMALSTPHGDFSYSFKLEGNRIQNKEQLAEHALAKLLEWLESEAEN